MRFAGHNGGVTAEQIRELIISNAVEQMQGDHMLSQESVERLLDLHFQAKHDEEGDDLRAPVAELVTRREAEIIWNKAYTAMMHSFYPTLDNEDMLGDFGSNDALPYEARWDKALLIDIAHLWAYRDAAVRKAMIAAHKERKGIKA